MSGAEVGRLGHRFQDRDLHAEILLENGLGISMTRGREGSRTGQREVGL